MQTVAYRIAENGMALKELTEKHGVILHDTPNDYFKEYGRRRRRISRRTQRRIRSSRRLGLPESLGRHRNPVLGARAKANAAMGGAYAAELAKKKPAAASSGGTSSTCEDVTIGDHGPRVALAVHFSA